MEQFMLWKSPISLFCQEVKGFNDEAEGLKKQLKAKFSEVFSVSLGRCTKIKTKLELKENLQTVFKNKRNIRLS